MSESGSILGRWGASEALRQGPVGSHLYLGGCLWQGVCEGLDWGEKEAGPEPGGEDQQQRVGGGLALRPGERSLPCHPLGGPAPGATASLRAASVGAGSGGTFGWPRASRSCSPGCRLGGDLRGEEVWGPRFPSNRLFPLTSVTRPPAGLCLFLKLTAPRSPRCRAPGRPRGQRPRCLPTARGAEREGKAPELRAAGPPRPLPGPGGVTSVWKATEARSGDGCAAALHTHT